MRPANVRPGGRCGAPGGRPPVRDLLPVENAARSTGRNTRSGLVPCPNGLELNR
ncbi:hypothetical protein FTUN_4710 [Frigoriglobus tundricola]|uniref:Uncharacterized protein n=1 Tax=Frigoriglobus tundricola TaxID=2774151 RepID=A0A6M5YSV9_9BACT|nr:hypothetical protein FTUN_4710 [Frigoriglobus tundricola]